MTSVGDFPIICFLSVHADIMKIITVAAILIFLGLGGCLVMSREFHYRVILVNLSDERIVESLVVESTDRYRYGGGVLSPAGYSAHAGPMETPPNDVFIVRWKNSEGVQSEERFDLRNRVNGSFKGEIVFVFGPSKKFDVEIVNPPDTYPIPRRR